MKECYPLLRLKFWKLLWYIFLIALRTFIVFWSSSNELVNFLGSIRCWRTHYPKRSSFWKSQWRIEWKSCPIWSYTWWYFNCGSFCSVTLLHIKKLTFFLMYYIWLSQTHLTFGKEFTQAVELKQVAQQDAERARFLVERVSFKFLVVR